MLCLQQWCGDVITITDTVTGASLEVMTLSKYARIGFTASKRFSIVRNDAVVKTPKPSQQNIQKPEED